METAKVPLPTMLSHTLVALTIEVDNEYEHRMPSRTTMSKADGEARNGPWLISLAMYANFLQYVPDEGVSVKELEQLALSPLNLHGMCRWGYVRAEPPPAGPVSKKPGPNWIVRPTSNGRRAQKVWGQVLEDVEKRWADRAGPTQLYDLRVALSRIVDACQRRMPEYLPILGYGLYTAIPADTGVMASPAHNSPHLTVLLSRMLLAFALEFESQPGVSLAISANILRLVDAKGARVPELPRLSGVSKESISMGVGYLQTQGYAAIEPESDASQTKLLQLTPKGAEARHRYFERLKEIEESWRTRFGADAVDQLRDALTAFAGNEGAFLWKAMEPYPDGWRATVPRPKVLPHFPMVLHRGGYPDGS